MTVVADDGPHHVTKLDASLPVAMFDSGVGGLTVLHECLVSLPQEDFLYLGDTELVPLRHARPRSCCDERIAAIADQLLDRGAKLLVIACNTATAIGDDVAREVAGERGVEVVPVVEPQAEIAAAITDSGRVGVLATPNTVESGAYRRALEAQGRALEVTEVEAPRLAPFIQEGSPFDESVMTMARAYCEPLKRAEVDTLILGCTHYPLVAPMLQRILGRDVRLVSGGHAVAAAVQRTLERSGLARPPAGEGRYDFLCTGDTDSFREARHPLPADAARRGRAGGDRSGGVSLLRAESALNWHRSRATRDSLCRSGSTDARSDLWQYRIYSLGGKGDDLDAGLAIGAHRRPRERDRRDAEWFPAAPRGEGCRRGERQSPPRARRVARSSRFDGGDAVRLIREDRESH